MNSRRPWLALTLLLLLTILAFWPLVLNPDETLYSDTSDLLAQHLPAKLFLVRSLRETGELPLWNPEQYAGSPFVHDIQVGLFYPPHLPLYVLPESAVGRFLSWLVFGHVVLAGWLMYAYGRHAGLGELGAFTAGAGFMLAPRWLMQLFLAGHVVTAGIAWLPLVLLCVERAIQRRSLRWTVGAGLAYALLILGTHPQWTFYASLLIGLWPLRLLASHGEPGRVSAGSATTPQALPALTQPGSPLRTRTVIARWLLVEAAVVLIGVALCAVQLLPTLEAAGETSRSRGMARSWSLPGGLLAATTLIGPFPQRTAEPVHWESRGAIGLTWAVLALAACWLGGRAARVPAWIALGLLGFALGGSVLFDRLPGFSTFRMPTRMLLTLAFPVAFLAGLAVRSIATAPDWPGRVFGRATGFVVLLAAGPGLLALLAGTFPDPSSTAWGWRVYWLAVPAGWLAFLWRAPHLAPPARGLACAGLLCADVLICSLPYPDTRRQSEVYEQPPFRFEWNPRENRIYDPDFPEGGCWLGPGSPAASANGLHSVRGFNPLDVARYRQFLAFIADVGVPQQAFSGDFTHPVTVRFPVQNRSLFDLLGVSVVACPADDPPAGPGWSRLSRELSARSYNFLGPGLQDLPPLDLYANLQAFAPAFVVGEAVPQARADAEVLAQLKGLSFSRTVTLADWDPVTDPVPTPADPAVRFMMFDYRPNELVIRANGLTAGVLVLTDPWYPGWECYVDGVRTRIWRANYAFRGVMVPAGTQEVVFRFEPKSYRLGRAVSVTGAGLVAGLLFGAFVRLLRTQNRTN